MRQYAHAAPQAPRGRPTRTRAIPASAQPASSASRPKPSTGPSAPVPCRPPARGGLGAPGQEARGEVVAVDALQPHRRRARVAGGVAGLGQHERACSWRGRGVGAAGRALDQAAEHAHRSASRAPGIFVSGRHARPRARASAPRPGRTSRGRRRRRAASGARAAARSARTSRDADRRAPLAGDDLEGAPVARRRSSTRRPPCQAKPGESITPAELARVPPLIDAGARCPG